jgi:hypothetical protein
MLPPTSDELNNPESPAYFVWWLNMTIGQFRNALRESESDLDARAYWLGALLREANTRDVWLFTSTEEIRRTWPRLQRHLGRKREMWRWLLDIDSPPWPPPEARRAR